MTEIIAQTKRDKAALLQLLGHAQSRAAKEKQPVLVSISLEVNFLEPLAVLESIWEPSQWHAYFENVAEERAFAAAEAVTLKTFSGSSRCEQAEAWLNNLLETCIEAGDTDFAESGPQAMVGMTFADSVPEDSDFAPLSVWIPRWQICRTAKKTIAVANAMVDADADIQAIAERTLRAHGRFAEFDYRDNTDGFVAEGSLKREPPLSESFKTGVARAVADIQSGQFKKVVLARKESFISKTKLDPIQPLARMREQFWGCHCFAFGNDTGTSFVGATPELLFRLENRQITTHALAGSIGRGANARDDAENGNTLLNSKKDRHEQDLVREAIERRLRQLGLEPEASSRPKLLKLKNIQHLNTDISADVHSRVSFWDLLNALHPTPAVGGSPREVVIDRIQDYENLDRGLYAGAVGFVNKSGDGQAFVAIRSASVSEYLLEIFAGAGIVNGSNPDKEWKETDLKMNAMRSVFGA